MATEKLHTILRAIALHSLLLGSGLGLTACGGGQTGGLIKTEGLVSIAQAKLGFPAAAPDFAQINTTVFENAQPSPAKTQGGAGQSTTPTPAFTSNPTRSTMDSATPTLAVPICPYVYTGKYRFFDFGTTETISRYSTFQFDAATLSGLNASGNPFALKTVFNSPCKFVSADAAANQTFIVAPSGMVFNTYPSSGSGQTLLGFAMPDLPSSVKDLAGTYVYTDFTRATPSSALASKGGLASINSNGELTIQDCGNSLAVCIAPVRVTRLAKHPSGYYYDAEAATQNNSGLTLHFHPTANGEASFLVVLPGNKGVMLGTRQAPAVSTIGKVQSTWDVTIFSTGLSGSPTFGGALATVAVDSATNISLRRSVATGRTDTFTTNDPLTGFGYRPSGSSVLNSGTTTTFASLKRMELRGTGVLITSVIVPGIISDNVNFSIDKLSRFSNTNYREIYKYTDPAGSFNSIGTTTVGTNDLLSVEGATHRITDLPTLSTTTTSGSGTAAITVTTTNSGLINLYPQGGATALSGVASGFSSRLMMLCNNVPGQGATKSTHILVSDNMVPVTSASELGTATLLGREDCQAASQTITFALDGSAQFTDSGGVQSISAADMAALFSANGLTRTDPSNGNISKTQLKIYKATSNGINGGPAAAFFLMVEIGRNLTDPSRGYLVYWAQ